MSTMQVANLQMADILFDEDFNCRGPIAPMDVVDLAKNIQENGLIQPVVVTTLSNTRKAEHPDKKYLLIAGYRRFTAFRVNKQTEIPAVVRDDIKNEVNARFFNLSENLQRSQLNIVQEARALKKLEALGVTEEDAGIRLNMSRGWVQVRYMVLRLPEVVQAEIAAGWLTQKQIRDAYTALRESGEKACYEKVKDIKDNKIKGRKGPKKKRKTKKEKEKELQSKKHRSREEIFELQAHIYDEFGGNNILTRLLAWAAGEIPSVDVHTSLREYAHEKGRAYRAP